MFNNLKYKSTPVPSPYCSATLTESNFFLNQTITNAGTVTRITFSTKLASVLGVFWKETIRVIIFAC